MSSITSRGGERGFTLLELLVIIIIIAVLATYTLLSISFAHSDEMKQEARRLQALMEIAAQEALISGKEYGVMFGLQKYQFMTLEKMEDKLQCTPISEDEHLSEPRELPGEIELELYIESSVVDYEAENPIGCHVFMFSSGEMTDFELFIRQPDSNSYRLKGYVTGLMELTQEGSDEGS